MCWLIWYECIPSNILGYCIYIQYIYTINIIYICVCIYIVDMHELRCFQTIIFHSFNIDEVLWAGLLCFVASHNAPRGFNYEQIYSSYSFNSGVCKPVTQEAGAQLTWPSWHVDSTNSTVVIHHNAWSKSNAKHQARYNCISHYIDRAGVWNHNLPDSLFILTFCSILVFAP